MSLDLTDLIEGWDCPPGEVRARTVEGRDGTPFVQLRVDLGVMQMFPEGRPDGERCHGLPSAREFIAHELRVGNDTILGDDLRELERELTQTNYRRLAFSTLAEDACRDNDPSAARDYISQAIRDIDACRESLDLLQQCVRESDDPTAMLPTLVFDRARLLSQLRIVEGNYERAIEDAEAGADDLDDLLSELGYDEEQREQDPGVNYLLELGRRLRRDYGITQTLREQLEQAIEDDDFERAAQLHGELAQRDGTDSDQTSTDAEA